MARFQDLSTELVLGILEKVLPGDIESMSLVSKGIYELAFPRLKEHRKLRRRYTNFRNMVKKKSSKWNDPGALLVDLLCTIMTDARVGDYVKKIDIVRWNFGAKLGWKPDASFKKQVTRSGFRLPQDSKTNMEIIEEAIRATEIIPTDEVDDWLYQIWCGNEDPLVALLLLHAPNLQTLKFVTPYRHNVSSYLLKTIQRVAGQGSTVKPYLLILKSVEIYFAGCSSLDFVEAFMSLPSLTSIKTDGIPVGGWTHEANSLTQPQLSNVMEMSFRSSLIHEKVLLKLLQRMKNLKTFVYNFSHLSCDSYENIILDCPPMIKLLEENTSQTLEHLNLATADIEISQIASMRGFHALRELEIKADPCSASAIANLGRILPASIERLVIHWNWYTITAAVIKESTAAFLELIRESKTQLANLRSLQVCTNNLEFYEALWDCWGSNKTAQLNTKLSFKIKGRAGSGEIPAWVDNVCTCGQDCFGTASLQLAQNVGCLRTKLCTNDRCLR